MKNFFRISLLSLLLFGFQHNSIAAEKVEYLKTDWSFKGIFGKFDRGALQRGYQVYTEVCASCHSMKYLSYRNLAEKGGPEFSEAEAKAIAASFEVKDGPNAGRAKATTVTRAIRATRSARMTRAKCMWKWLLGEGVRTGSPTRESSTRASLVRSASPIALRSASTRGCAGNPVRWPWS